MVGVSVVRTVAVCVRCRRVRADGGIGVVIVVWADVMGMLSV